MVVKHMSFIEHGKQTVTLPWISISEEPQFNSYPSQQITMKYGEHRHLSLFTEDLTLLAIHSFKPSRVNKMLSASKLFLRD